MARPTLQRPVRLALILGLLLAACGNPPAPLPPTSPEPAAYRVPDSVAGAESCADCHADIVQSWSQTGMARSLGPVALGELDAMPRVSDGPSGYEYQYARSPETPEHVLAETHTTQTAHAFGTSVVLGIGSGELDRSYAVRYGASLRFSPLEVLPHGEKRRAALAPGHMMQSGLRYGTPITNECLACHTDNVPPKRFPLDLDPGPGWKPRGISCAACHARSEQHAAWQSGSGDGEDPMQDHAAMGRSRQLSTCAACHLQGDARVDLTGDPEARFQPGGELLEQRAVFVAADQSAEVGFVSHVERLALSACFRASSMTCSSCHDPHRSLHQDEERARVRSACLQCHGDSAPLGSFEKPDPKEHGPDCSRMPEQMDQAGDCVSCHMPQVGTFDVAAVLIHDHHIRLDISGAPGPSSPNQLRVLETKAGTLKRFNWPWLPEPQADPGLEMQAYASAKLESEALKLLDQPAGQDTQNRALFQHLRGILLEKSARPKEAQVAYERALQLDPSMAASATNLGLILAASGRPREALRHFSELLNRFPQAEGALRNRAIIAMQLGNRELFAADLQKAFAINPSAAIADALSKYYASQNDALGADRWQQLARQLDANLPR